MNELTTLSQKMIPALELEMGQVLNAHSSAPDPFYGMMQYHMGWVDQYFQPVEVHSGKRIRPLTTMLVAQAAGGSWQQSLPAAAAVEILHNFSLIHDDIEDASPTRRGRLTLWKIWGEAQAINSGDAMFAVAHLAMSRLIERDVPPATVVRALRRFDETSLHLTQGQYNDMDFEIREKVLVGDYIDMITGKTAVLLSLCAELGALVAGQDDETIANYAAFGLNLGLAFQVIDDILGIWGDESRTGKSAATDIVTKKKTLPVLYGLERSSTLRTLYQNEEADDRFVTEVVTLLDDIGAREYASATAKEYSIAALAYLDAANPTGEAGTALRQLAAMLLQRDF